MGNIIFRKPLTTLERLEKLEESILNAEEYRKTTQLSQKRYVAYLIIFSSLVYLFAFIVGYFYYYPLTALDIFLRLIPLILFPFLIIGLKALGCWWFILRLESNDQSLERMKRERRDILDQVKSKEVYLVAKQILEKFDPQAQLERLKIENKADEEKLKEISIKQRNAKLMANSFDEKSSDNLTNTTQAKSPEKQLPRPIMPHNRTVLDKLIDYFLVDGPENRYALICKFCYAHNGMALLEDFRNLSYKCAYCHSFNESAAKSGVKNGDDENKTAITSPKRRPEFSPGVDSGNRSIKNSPLLNDKSKMDGSFGRTKFD